MGHRPRHRGFARRLFHPGRGRLRVRATGVYAELLRWFAEARNDDPKPLPVFVEPRGEGASIPLEVQAQLVTEVDDVVDVRFIDSRDEAFVTDDDGMTVEGDTFMTMAFELDLVEDGRVVSGDPEQISTPSAGDD